MGVLITAVFGALLFAPMAAFPAEQKATPQPDIAPVLFERQAMGEWKIEGSHVQQLDPKGMALLLHAGREQSRYSVSTRLRPPGKNVGEEAGLLLNFTDPENYLAFSIQRRQSGPFAVLRIARKKGVSFVADQFPAAASKQGWHELRAEVDGADVYCYLGGTLALSYSFQGTPPPYNSHGKTWDPDPVKGRTGLFAVDAVVDFEGFRFGALAKIWGTTTPQKGHFDQRGKLLPMRPYSDTMRRFTDWFLHSDGVMDKTKAPESIRSLPVYLLTNFVSIDDKMWDDGGGEFAFNHSLIITGAIQFFMHTGERKYLELARRAADWQIEHSTPSDWALPHLAASFVKYHKDGSWEGLDWGYEPDKSAYVGYALLRLNAATGDRKYLDAALHIAATLRKFQGPEGNWPFRVNARTGETKYGYTCSQLWYVWFFERLAEATGDDSYLANRDRAFRWMLNNPVRTNEWIGLYGDIASGARSFDQWVALETAIYLLDHRAEDPDYVRRAKDILDWINRALVTDYGFFPHVPGVVEQSQYRVVLTHHELRLAEIYAKLWEVTRKPEYRDSAVEIANSVTWNQVSDGKIRQGFWHHAQAVPLILSFNEQFARVMAAIPETAPRRESHLLQTSGLFNDVHYGPRQIDYRTSAPSEDVLVVASAPVKVSCLGRPLERSAQAKLRAGGWYYDAATGFLKIRHSGGDVTITLE